MEAVKKSTHELADFIYRDGQRIASLTAQLFGNTLVGSEVTRTGKDASEKGVGLAAVLTGALKSATESSTASKDSFQPHDAAAAGLITNLGLLGRISDDVDQARPGEIVRASGTLYLFDGALVRATFSTVLPGLLGIMGDLPPQLAAALQGFMDLMPVPTGFLLRTSSRTLVGTIDPAGLHEPISAAYFKHGADGIAGAGIIGVREGAGPAGDGDKLGSQLFDAAQGFAKLFRDMMFPSDSIRVAPIAIYRNVH